MPAVTRSTSFDLWGGTAVVATQAVDDAAHARAVDSVRTWLDIVDRTLSTYRDDSEITALNSAHGAETTVGPVLREAISVALVAAERSAGIVDPTVGTVTLSPPGEPTTLTRRVSYRDVRLRDVDGGAVVTMPPGVRLDLGATAKAWAADRAAVLAAQACGGGVLVSLLGDLATSGPAPDVGWTVVVTDDHREGTGTANTVAQSVAVTGGGLATSSTTVRSRLAADGRELAHLVDPRRLRPVSPVWRTVSVAAGDCVTANTASTAAVILGEDAAAWLTTTGLPARLVGVDGHVLTLGGWPAEGPAA